MSVIGEYFRTGDKQFPVAGFFVSGNALDSAEFYPVCPQADRSTLERGHGRVFFRRRF
jgi:hypothetical protein